MKVLVLGAAGFIGATLVRALCAEPSLVIDGAMPRRIRELVLADYRPVPRVDNGGGIAIRIEQGDIGEPVFLERLLGDRYDCIFHLAAMLTLDAEKDFVRSLDVNVHALMRLLDHCRTQAASPAVVFASSISTFGGTLPEVVDDDVVQTPETSYGCHKLIAEVLISDYSRRGFIDGRVLRLPVVLTHPGPASGSVSDRVAALIREPLNGRDVVCPLDPQLRIPVASARSVVGGLRALLARPSAVFGATRAMNLPSLTVTPAAIEATVTRASLPGRPPGKVFWQPEAHLQRIAEGWPRSFTSRRALECGIAGDASLEAVVAAYIEDHLGRG
jgi:nucleoside-diphosphate-sugar epimerase